MCWYRRVLIMVENFGIIELIQLNLKGLSSGQTLSPLKLSFYKISIGSFFNALLKSSMFS